MKEVIYPNFLTKKSKVILLLLMSVLMVGCSSVKMISERDIPNEKKFIFLVLDENELKVESGGYVYGNFFYSGSESSYLNSLENKILIKQLLSEKGYFVTNHIEKADLILYGGCKSSDIQSVITIVLVDKETEEEYIVTQGSYGMGLDLDGDIKGALKNALKNIPNR